MESTVLVVSAKLRPPILRGNTVQRPRLLEALNLATQRRLTLVCAGPGYGKTTLLAAITSLPNQVVWYSLGQSDQDLVVFITYLLEGIRQHIPGFGGRVLQLLTEKGSTKAGPEAIAGHLVNALGEIDGRLLVVVLDDYHFVDRNQGIRKVVDYLLTHLPANVHLVIAARRQPRLSSLPRLAMTGEVNEILEEDLRFTADEVHELFSQVHCLRPGEEVIRAVVEQTEGWVIGLQLAGQSLKVSQGKNAEALPAAMGANKGRLFDYLTEEVFKRQPANVQRFLIETSVLSTLSQESCDTIFERTDSAAMLDLIEQNNLFTIKVHEGCWRYHHLFRDFLRQQASREFGYLKHLHLQAGIYFESGEDYSQANHHYLAGAHFHNAVRLISNVGQAMFTTACFDTLTFWIGQIPHRDLEESPYLLLLQGEVLDAQGHYDRALGWLERAKAAYAARKDGIGLSKVLRTKAHMALWRFGRNTEAEALYLEGLGLLGPQNKVEMADLLRGLALSYLCGGNRVAAEETYQRALRIYEEVGDEEGTLATLISPGTWIYWWRGDFSEGLASLQRALNLAQQLDSKYMLAECLNNLSIMLRFLGRCEEAKASAEKALQLSREIGSVQLEARSMTYAGVAHDGRQVCDLVAGRRYLVDAERLAESTGNERLRNRALTEEGLLLLRLGDVKGAIQAENRALEIAEGSTDQRMIASTRMFAGAALLNQQVERAESLLLQARDDFLRYEDKFNLTRVDLWLAALYARSNLVQALEYFKTSLDLARANGYEFWLLEEHRTSVPLLALAIDQRIHAEYCEHLLKEIGPVALDSLTPLLDHPDERARRVAMGRIGSAIGPERDVSAVPVPPLDKSSAKDEHSTSYASDPRETVTPLRIRCLGNFQVYVGDRLIQERDWRRKDVKSLLKYLAVTRNHTANREEIVDLFWGGLDPEAAKARLWKALYLLRRMLEPQSKSHHSAYISVGQGLLGLRNEAIGTIDVDEFVRRIDAGQHAERLGQVDEAGREYETAAILYTGEFLSDDPYEDWTIGKREYFKKLYISTLEKLARWCVAKNDDEAAISYLQKLLVEDSTREDIHVTLMQCLARMGRRREALEQYVVCRRNLKEDLGLDPTYQTEELHARLLAGENI